MAPLRRPAILNPERGTDTPLIGSARGGQGWAAAASRGDEYLVVWTDSRRRDIYEADIYAARVSAQGNVLETTGIPIAASEENETEPDVVWNGTTYFVVWSAPSPGKDVDIWGARVSRDGVLIDGDPIRLASVQGSQQYPKVAWNGSQHLVIWENDGSSVRGVRVDRDGRVMDATPIIISHPTYRDLTPAVASDGRDFLVVWEDNDDRDIAGAVVLANGTLAHAKDIQIAHVAGHQMRPLVVWAGAAYVVAWEDSRPSLVKPGAADELWGARVGADGQVRDPRGIPFCNAQTGISYPSLSSNGKRAWLTWNDGRTGPQGRYGTFIDSTGPIADTSGQLVIPHFAQRSQIAQFAWGGTEYLGLFSRTMSALDGVEVVVRRFSETGTDLDMSDRQVSHAANRQMETAIATNGQGYLLAWVDDRDDEGDIYAARLDATGRVLDDPAIAVSRAAHGQRAPSAVWNGTDYVVSWFDPEWGGNKDDLFAVRVATDGRVRDATPIALGKTTFKGYDEVPQLVWSGTDSFVWVVYGDGAVWALRLSRDGSLLDSAPLRLSPPNSGRSAMRPTVSCSPASCLVAWADTGTFADSSEISGVRLGQDGKSLDAMPRALITRPGQQTRPRLQWHGNGYLLAFADGARDGWNLDMYAALFGGDGTMTKAPFLIGQSKGERPFTAAVWTGTHFLVAWDQFSFQNPTSDIFGARISETGTLVDATPQAFVRSRYADRQPVLASLGDSTAAVAYWRFDDSAGLAAERVKLRFFNNDPPPDGGVLDPDTARPVPDADTADRASGPAPDAAVVTVDASPDRAPAADVASVPPDAAVVPVDAGVAPDTASPDGAAQPVVPDAARADSAPLSDATSPDALLPSPDGPAQTAAADAAVPGPPRSTAAKSKSGCSCHLGASAGSGPEAGTLPALALVAGLLCLRRRRR